MLRAPSKYESSKVVEPLWRRKSAFPDRESPMSVNSSATGGRLSDGEEWVGTDFN